MAPTIPTPVAIGIPAGGLSAGIAAITIRLKRRDPDKNTIRVPDIWKNNTFALFITKGS